MKILPVDRTALTQYLEIELLDLCKMTETSLDSDAIPQLYENAYKMLERFENTLQTQQDIFNTQIHEKSS